jgi:hypothetical protein
MWTHGTFSEVLRIQVTVICPSSALGITRTLESPDWNLGQDFGIQFHPRSRGSPACRPGQEGTVHSVRSVMGQLHTVCAASPVRPKNEDRFGSVACFSLLALIRLFRKASTGAYRRAPVSRSHGRGNRISLVDFGDKTAEDFKWSANYHCYAGVQELRRWP